MRTIFALVAALLIGSIVVPASAAVYETGWYEDDYSALTHWGNNPPNPAVYLEYPKFDDSVYTLLRVDWDMRAEVGANYFVENLNEDSGGTIAADIWAQISWYKPDLTLFNQLVPLVQTGTLTLAAYDGTLDWNGPSGDRVLGLNQVLNDAGFMVSGAAFDMFKGVGTVQTAAKAMGYHSSDGMSNVNEVYHTGGILRGRIKYTYSDDIIPEPGTSTLFLAGLAAFGFIRRRRSA